MKILLFVFLVAGCAVDTDGTAFGGARPVGGSPGVLGRGTGGVGGSVVVASGGVLGTGGMVAIGTGGLAAIGTGGMLAVGGSAGSVAASSGAGGTPGTGGVVGTGGGAAGMRGTGGAGGGPDRGTPSTSLEDCSRPKFWDLVNDAKMRPGSACVNCHTFTVSGTVFMRQDEPSNCYGVDGTVTDVQVLVTDAMQHGTLLAVNESGNFWTNAVVRFPITVATTSRTGDRLRMMDDTVMNGDCNSCHTATTVFVGQPSPGRVLAP